MHDVAFAVAAEFFLDPPRFRNGDGEQGFRQADVVCFQEDFAGTMHRFKTADPITVRLIDLRCFEEFALTDLVVVYRPTHR